MAEQTYQGGCHCGALRYEVDLDIEKGTTRCNCSLCSKARAWFAFAPFDKFHMTKGGDADEVRYRWTPPNRPKPSLTYHHCSTCGLRTHADGMGPKGEHIAGIAVATLEGVEPKALAASVHYVDGLHDHFDRVPEDTDAL